MALCGRDRETFPYFPLAKAEAHGHSYMQRSLCSRREELLGGQPAVSAPGVDGISQGVREDSGTEMMIKKHPSRRWKSEHPRQKEQEAQVPCGI